MTHHSEQRGFALITVLGILALFLLVSILLLTMTSQNSQNFGNAYQKQRYYDVAEAGIDRGLQNLDSVLPSPGTAGFLTATPAPPPAPPTSNQTPLPNVPNVPYFYSYWYNSNTSPAGVATADPLALAGTFGVAPGSTINVPAEGAVIWSYTTTGNRDVAVETVVSRFAENTSSCALCAGQTVAVTGADTISAPPTVCGGTTPGTIDKVCSDPKSSPSPAPTNVPIVAGGSYSCGGSVPKWCAYGDGSSTSSTPNPTLVQQNQPPSVTSGFLASQGTIDQLGDAAAWKTASTTSSNIKYVDCTIVDCTKVSTLQPYAPLLGQVTFVNGNLTISSPNNAVLSYGGTFIVSKCLQVSGQVGMAGTTSTADVIVLSTDSQSSCSASGTQYAAVINGGGATHPPGWNGGTLYAAQGSAYIGGNGSVNGYNFYGAVIAAGNITVTGNGYFAWESSLKQQALDFGPFAIDSFAQY